MAEARAADGTSLHWEERGSGPTVLLVPYWSMHPMVFEPLAAELASDSRVVGYDERGTGRSDRVGPYDTETAAGDLEAVCEAIGGAQVALCLVNAANSAVRVADHRPDLLERVVCMGSAPFGVGELSASESLIASRAVVGAFLQQIETDYRGAIRSVLAGASMGFTDDEVRERVRLQAEYSSGEAAAARARSWAADEGGLEHGRQIGSRLAVILTDAMGGEDQWFPAAREMEPIVAEAFPQASVHWTSNGIVTAAAECAGIIRAVAASPAYDRQQ